MAVTKKCTSYGSEESYKILNGETVLKTSAPFANNEQRADEYCLAPTTNNQYTFKIIDSYGDSWYSGSWVSVAGLYGNVVLKTFLVEKREEEYALSLYYPIMKDVEWKVTSSSSSIDANWNTADFSDSNWQSVTLGSTLSPLQGTQYFRKSFTSVANMAAYEVDMNYKFGIIAYVNGVEIFRDNMPSGAIGPVLPFTPCTGSYASYDFRGVIRAATDVNSNANNALAVELHYTALAEHEVRFDAFVAAVASSTSKDILKNAIMKYDGTVVVVSHDREFLDGMVEKVYEFRDGGVKEYLGGIYYFLEKRKLESLQEIERRDAPAKMPAKGDEPKPAVSGKLSYEQRKEQEKQLRKAKKVVETIEAELADIEKRIAEYDARFAAATEYNEADYKAYNELKTRYDHQMHEWEKASYELEIIENE